MPEGDTIFRTAQRLRAALGGAVVTGVSTTVPQVRQLGEGRLVGQAIEDVESRGKHLLCWFAPSDLALHTHMMMSGSWHLYRPGQRWRKPVRFAKVVLEVDAWTAVCFSAPVCELLSRTQVRRHRSLAALGPDALGADVDLDAARRRLDERPAWTIGEALLDQRVLAGVGNVYKTEVLFLHGIDPWARVADLECPVRTALLATVTDLLRDNAAPDRALRRTTGDESASRLHVYGRARRPCPRCSTPISVARQGQQARLTFWCTTCQGLGPRRPAPG